MVSAQRDVAPRPAGELLGHKHRLREEALDLAGARHQQLVVLAQLVDAQDGDDVLQVLVALQHTLDLAGRGVVLLADDHRVEDARGRGQRVDRRVDALLDDRALQGDGGVEVGEGRHRRRVGVVVGRDVHRLHRGDRAGAGRGDALLQLAHLGRQRRLVADRRRHAPEQRRDLRAGHAEAEDVVDEQQHVAALVAEVLRHGQRRQARRAGARPAARSSGRRPAPCP